MNETERGNSRKLHKAQGELAKHLNMIPLFGILENEYFLKVCAKEFAEVFEEFGHLADNDGSKNYDDCTVELLDNQMQYKTILDRMMLRMVNVSLELLQRRAISDWARSDSSTALKIVSIQNELAKLSGQLIRDMAAIGSIAELFTNQKIDFCDDHDLDFDKLKSTFDFKIFEESASWLNFLSNTANQIDGQIDEQIATRADSIIKGRETFKETAVDLEISPPQLKKLFEKKGLLASVFNTLWDRHKGNQKKLADEIGVTKKSIRNWAEKYRK